MRIKHLYIENFKLLQNFNINFQKPITLFIGKNGSGKSSLLEAIAWIFRSAHLSLIEGKNETPPFNFKITYEIRLEKTMKKTSTSAEFQTDYVDVTLFIEKTKTSTKWIVQTDNNTYSKEELIERYGLEKLLPGNTLIYYSGWLEKMQFICSEHETIYKSKLFKSKSEYDISTSADEVYSKIDTLPLLYIEKKHFPILLATLYSYEYNDRVDNFFSEQLKMGIPQRNPLVVFIKKKQWDQKSGHEDFWGAKGELRSFLNVIRRFSYEETYQNISKTNKTEQILFNFNLSDWHKLREFYGEERKLFYLFHMLESSDMLAGIQVFLSKADSDISHYDLSEGEQQVITINAINEILIEENTLLLLDEPDTYLHPQWQTGFLQNVYEYTDFDISQPQFLIASHSSVMLSNLKNGHLFKMKKGRAIPIKEGYYGREYGFNLSAMMLGEERNSEAQAEFILLFELIDNDKIEQAEEYLKKIKDKYPDDPEISRADTMITFLKD